MPETSPIRIQSTRANLASYIYLLASSNYKGKVKESLLSAFNLPALPAADRSAVHAERAPGGLSKSFELLRQIDTVGCDEPLVDGAENETAELKGIAFGID